MYAMTTWLDSYPLICGSEDQRTPTGDPTNGACGRNEHHPRITSESQWRTFANSLAAEGLVVELAEQQQLQKLWDRAVVGANSFGRKYVLYRIFVCSYNRP